MFVHNGEMTIIISKRKVVQKILVKIRNILNLIDKKLSNADIGKEMEQAQREKV